MIKKILLAIGAISVALIIITVIPISSLIKDETASDAVIVVGSILLALTIYKLLKPLVIK
jgi:hypothetical protein